MSLASDSRPAVRTAEREGLSNISKPGTGHGPTSNSLGNAPPRMDDASDSLPASSHEGPEIILDHFLSVANMHEPAK